MTKGETMKFSRLAGVPVLLVLAAGMMFGQDVAKDVDKGAAKTGSVVKQTGKKVAHTAKSGAKDAGHGTKVAAKDSAKGVKKATQKTGEGIKDVTGDGAGKPTPPKPN
jgi:hypothetical protein